MTPVGSSDGLTGRVCRVDDIPVGEGRAVEIDGRRIAVFRTRHGWYAVDQRCPHRGGPLADGIVADGCVTCPLHDRRFDLASGRCQSDPDLRVDVYHVVVREADVWLDGAALAHEVTATLVA
jgi:nitrite reductase (NADH) small subunit